MTAQEGLIAAGFPLLAYVVAATPFGVLLSRAKGIDIRKHGSGNVGATNVGRVLGRKWGYACFLLDVAKGFLPVFLAGLYVRREADLPTMYLQLAWLLTALMGVIGHVFPFWLRFRGGKGVATALGVVLGFWPFFTVPGAVAFAIWIAVTLISRYVSLASIVAVTAFPVLFVLFALLGGRDIRQMLPLLAFALAMAGLVVYSHRGNIRRLLNHTESKIGAGKGVKSEA